ncbi:MAG: SCO family protein [Cyclobacteriaceae bacterium]
MSLRTNLYLFAITLAISSCKTSNQEDTDIGDIPLPFYNSSDFTPLWIEEGEEGYKEIHTIEGFTFQNQEGETVTEKNFENKIYVANFFFTICPSVCPRMTENLKKVQEKFSNDPEVLLLSHTVMPWVDSVEVLKKFAIQREINPDTWHLVTGSKEDLYGIGRNSYFADEGFGKSITEEADFLHTENVVLVDRKRRIRGVYNGTLPLDMKRLIEDIESLKENS